MWEGPVQKQRALVTLRLEEDLEEPEQRARQTCHEAHVPQEIRVHQDGDAEDDRGA
jgi:hypothetical protein